MKTYTETIETAATKVFNNCMGGGSDSCTEIPDIASKFNKTNAVVRSDINAIFIKKQDEFFAR